MKTVLLTALFIVFDVTLGSIGSGNGEGGIVDQGYLLVIPRVFRARTTVNVGVNIFGNISCDVSLKLYDSRNDRIISRSDGYQFQPNKAGELKLEVPEVEVKKIGATVCGIETERKEISYEVSTKNIFIQTDKPIYKPGQKVLIRIIYVDSELKPAGSKISSVVIQEPSGSKIMKWIDVKLQDGIANLDLLLSKEPVLGKWKIKATIEKITETKQIEIEKYVLPKFQLSIKPPAYLAWDQREVPVSICARYSYGKGVTGRLEARFCFKNIRRWNTDQICYTEVKNITGCEEFEVKELLHRTKISSYYYYGWYLHIKAIFTETSTGIKRKIESRSSSMQSRSKTMSLVGFPEHFKPGFPFKFKIKISFLDGKPVTDGELRVLVSRRRFYYIGSKPLFDKTYSVKNGFVNGVLEVMPHDTEQLSFRIQHSDWRLWAWTSSRAWYSPSLSYLQLINTRLSTPKVGGQGSVKVLYTDRNEEENNIDFHYKILCKGNLVLSGVIKESPSSNYSKLRKKRFTPKTYFYPTHPFINIPKPSIEQFELKFNITQDMVPSCRILVYFIRPDKETVGDSIVYHVEDKLENQVSIDFMEKQKKPGDKTKIVIKAKPGSRVSISALDKSVLLLRNANDVKKRELVGILKRQDVGGTSYYDNRCMWSWKKPHVADVSEAFNTAGVVFLSNLSVFTQPCHRNQPKFYEHNNRPVTTPAPYRWWWRHEVTLGPTEPEVTPAATEPEVTPAPTEPEVTLPATEPEFTPAATRRNPTATKFIEKRTRPTKTVKVRKNFPETWLWTEIKLNDTSGIQTIEVQVPDAITSWVASGFAMSSTYGMGVADQATLKAFQPFFVQMNLPYSVIRGEEIPVTVTVFNYLPSCVPIKLEINRESKDYKVTSLYLSKLCVCGDDGKSMKFKIIPFKLGHIPLMVKATTSEVKFCPNSTVYTADAVTRKLLVEPEGIKQEYTKGTFFCPEEGTYSETIDLDLPKDIVPGSILPKISVIGDIMGPAMTNLDGLLAMPYGCGEQNMAKFAPNIYIMDYLTNTDQVTEKIKNDATHYMNSGYQRELTYKRRSGSYSIFGNWDRQGSMMLTAFVLRSFARARKYIFIDEDENKHSIKWFTNKQKPSGCFPKYGQVFSKSLQGGLNSELAITSYVTIALLEAGLDNKTSLVTKALDCITKKLDDFQDSYTTSLVTYTLVLANHPKSGAMINRLKSKAVTKTAGQLYWSAGSDKPLSRTDRPEYYRFWYRPPSADVEMTGYALMAYLKHEESIKDVTKIIKWLSKQRNNYGGFSSTQDTCVALQALSEVAQQFYGKDASTNLNIQVNIKDIFGHNFKLTENNKLIMQRVEIPSNALPNELDIAATGPGCTLLQATVKYNIPVPDEIPAFKVNVSVHRREASAEEETTNCYPLQLKITAEWLKEDVSNMAIVDIKLVSGFKVNEDLLEEKLAQSLNQVGFTRNVLKRYDIDGQNVLLYFEEIKMMSFSLDIIQSTLVKKTKPGVVKVYDYYNPENEAKVMYNITEEDCYGEKIQKECPKCVSIDDFEEFFDKNINCSIYLMRAKSNNGLMKVKKAYIKTNRNQNYANLPYEMPEFCPCDEIYNGESSLVFGQSDYFRKNGREVSIVFNSGTTIAKWNGKRMKKIFRKKMFSKIYRRCKLLARG